MKTNFPSLNSTYNFCALKNFEISNPVAGDLEIRGSNHGSGSNFSLEIKKIVVSRIMNLALMMFSLLPCGLKHTQVFFLFRNISQGLGTQREPLSMRH